MSADSFSLLSSLDHEVSWSEVDKDHTQGLSRERVSGPSTTQCHIFSSEGLAFIHGPACSSPYINPSPKIIGRSHRGRSLSVFVVACLTHAGREKHLDRVSCCLKT